MAINYTTRLGLAQPEYLHDGSAAVTAVNASMTILDALFTYFIVDRYTADLMIIRDTAQPVIKL